MVQGVLGPSLRQKYLFLLGCFLIYILAVSTPCLQCTHVLHVQRNSTHYFNIKEKRDSQESSEAYFFQ